MLDESKFIKLVHAGQRAGKLATVGDLAEWFDVPRREVLSVAVDCGFYVKKSGRQSDKYEWVIEDTDTNVHQCTACYGPITEAGTWADHDVCSPRCYLLSHIDGMDAATGETLQLAIEQLIGGPLSPSAA